MKKLAAQRVVSGEFRLDAPRKAWLKILAEYPPELPYTFTMACLSARLDIDEHQQLKSIRQYMSIWRWSKKRVENQMDAIRAELQSWGVVIPVRIDGRGGARTQKKEGDKRGGKKGTKQGTKQKEKPGKTAQKQKPARNNGDKTHNSGGQKGDKEGDAYYTPHNTTDKERARGRAGGVCIDTDQELAAMLWDRVRKHDPEALRPDLSEWAAQIHDIHEVDGRTYAEIDRVMRWCLTDPSKDARWWRNTIVSAATFRQSFGSIKLQMLRKEVDDADKRPATDGGAGGARSRRAKDPTGSIARATRTIEPEEVERDLAAIEGIRVGRSGFDLS